jgi:hypothetical protein
MKDSYLDILYTTDEEIIEEEIEEIDLTIYHVSI